MNPEQTELFHQSLLRVLDRNGTRFGLGARALGILVGEFGFSPAEGDVEKQLTYMADGSISYVEQVNKGEFNPAARTWRLTAKGTNYLRTHGL